MNLSPNFTLAEFVRSQYAERNGISNTPNEEVIKNLRRVAYTLEIIRNELQSPVIISSGYRCPELNHGINGSKRSKHMQGLAVDFTVVGYTPAQVVERMRGMVGYDKLILEFDQWVHLGLSSYLKQQVLVATNKNGVTEYEVLT
jgi:zinc D-Ala-D-Ala carboxypeptidase